MNGDAQVRCWLYFVGGALLTFVVFAIAHDAYPAICKLDGGLWAAWAQVFVIAGAGIAATVVAWIQLGRFNKSIEVAAEQLRQDRKFNQAIQTSELIDEWNAPDLRDFRQSQTDVSAENDENREHVNRAYEASTGGDRVAWRAFIENTAGLAERILLYVREKLILREMLYDHIGYDVIATYDALKDVLSKRTYEDDMLYDSFRALVLDVKAYARAHPEIDIRPELLDSPTPELVSNKDFKEMGIST